MQYKHVGRIKNNKRKVIVAYRTVPGESDNCIVVTTQNLMADEHDALMQLVESSTGQSADEFAEVMSRAQLPDGRNMLASFHGTGKLIKVPTNNVEMTPDRNTVIRLDELNEMIAQQRGITVDDLSVSDPDIPKGKKPPETTVIAEDAVNTSVSVNDSGVLTDEELAAKYRSDATRLTKEAKRLRDEAEKLSPSKKRRSAKNAKAKPATQTSDNGSVGTDI